MKKKLLETIWAAPAATQPVERRVRFGRGELVLSLLPEQPIPDAGAMSRVMVDAAIVEAAAGHAVAPQLVFGPIRADADGAPVLRTHDSREFPVVHLETDRPEGDPLDYGEQMKLARAATGPAQVGAGDYAVGFIYRVGGADAYFYPLLAVSLPDDIVAFRDGTATTSDVIPLLPFQS